MIKKIITGSCLATFLIASNVVATELVYTPINPSFGGNPLNGSFLLSKAQSQNKHREIRPKKTYAENFQESLQRAYLNKLVREITGLAFGEEDANGLFKNNSTFVSGNHQIKIITDNSDSITVQITDITTNEVTIIEIPRFGG